ncbi:MAG: hypothetical protein WC764_00425 [Candidatus Paceibacterota bacterium]
MKYNITAKIALALGTVVLLGSATPALAATQLETVIARSDKQIDARIADLNTLMARVQEMKNVSADQKTSIAADVQNNVGELTALKAKIDADTELATAREDEKSILGSYRVYALIIPRGHLIAAADRIATLVGMMTTLSGKLQTRINEAQTAGKDVTALQTALTDLNAKLADASIQASAAINYVAPLVPDNGDKAVAKANQAALKSARADIKVGTSDLHDARKDIETIMKGLKAFNKTSEATSTPTTSAPSAQ